MEWSGCLKLSSHSGSIEGPNCGFGSHPIRKSSLWTPLALSCRPCMINTGSCRQSATTLLRPSLLRGRRSRLDPLPFLASLTGKHLSPAPSAPRHAADSPLAVVAFVYQIGMSKAILFTQANLFVAMRLGDPGARRRDWNSRIPAALPWLEARICRCLGRLEAAERGLAAVWHDFREAEFRQESHPGQPRSGRDLTLPRRRPARRFGSCGPFARRSPAGRPHRPGPGRKP